MPPVPPALPRARPRRVIGSPKSSPTSPCRAVHPSPCRRRGGTDSVWPDAQDDTAQRETHVSVQMPSSGAAAHTESCPRRRACLYATAPRWGTGFPSPTAPGVHFETYSLAPVPRPPVSVPPQCHPAGLAHPLFSSISSRLCGSLDECSGRRQSQSCDEAAVTN